MITNVSSFVFSRNGNGITLDLSMYKARHYYEKHLQSIHVRLMDKLRIPMHSLTISELPQSSRNKLIMKTEGKLPSEQKKLNLFQSFCATWDENRLNFSKPSQQFLQVQWSESQI